MTLTEFLMARIAEDEAERWALHRPDCNATASRLSAGPILGHTGGLPSYSAECDCGSPDRLLAACEAKRQMVEWADDASGKHSGIAHECAVSKADGMEILKALAHPYSSHPEFRPEWQP
jgi:hypothetical protein